jgi:hypothetical protein
MVKIYCVEDINDLKYVGSTKRNLRVRINEHRSEKKNKPNKNTSSYQLNLEYCIIYLLEECSEEDRNEREQYWIDNLDCVNKNRVSGVDQEKRSEYQRGWHRKNRKRLRDLTPT